MQDPRYQTSEDYRQEIADRVASAQVHRNAAEASAPSASAAAAPAVSPSEREPKVFRSEYEKVQAFSDPRYALDEAYREDVAQRVRATEQAKLND